MKPGSKHWSQQCVSSMPEIEGATLLLLLWACISSQGEDQREPTMLWHRVWSFSYFWGFLQAHITLKVLTSARNAQSLEKECFSVCFPVVTTLKSKESISWKMVAFKSSNEPNPAVSPSSFYKRLNNSLSTGVKWTPTSYSGKYQSSVVTNLTCMQWRKAHILSELSIRPKPRLH